MKVIEILESQPFEFAIRILLYIIYYVTDDIEPFQREIQPEEMWLYKYPDLTGYISVTFLWTIVYLAPALVFTIYYIKTKNRRDLIQAVLGILLSVYLTASITNTIKLIVGRPRPNFFWRCFPDGKYNLDILCTGDLKKVADGRKSFPSGHSSVSFSSLGFVSLYVSGKLHCFNSWGRTHTWRLLLAGLPLIVALFISLSRTADYHHHWQDVAVGSILGMLIAYLSYRHFYPALTKSNAHLPYVCLTSFECMTNKDSINTTTLCINSPLQTDSALKLV